MRAANVTQRDVSTGERWSSINSDTSRINSCLAIPVLLDEGRNVTGTKPTCVSDGYAGELLCANQFVEVRFTDGQDLHCFLHFE